MWLVTGGAGYIGSHVVRDLIASGRGVVIYDDLSTGSRSRIPRSVPLVEASTLDTGTLRTTLNTWPITGVMHLAGRKAVGESVQRPLWYYRENIGGVLSLLQAMQETGVTRLVYSSSAAVYGEPEVTPIREDAPCVPVSPYGETKLVGEWMIRDVARAMGLSWVALRYFNVAGAGSPDLGDTSTANLIPLVLSAIQRGASPRVYGMDYPTPDGTCVRDYIHVADLSEAHVAAAAACEGSDMGDVFNVGTGRGTSVLEVLRVVAEVTGRRVVPEVTGRRPGDPPVLVAEADRVEALGWVPGRDLADMVRSAWTARTS